LPQQLRQLGLEHIAQHISVLLRCSAQKFRDAEIPICLAHPVSLTGAVQQNLLAIDGAKLDECVVGSERLVALRAALRSARFISAPMAFGAKQLDIFRLLDS
jgi:hypothetical protein